MSNGPNNRGHKVHIPKEAPEWRETHNCRWCLFDLWARFMRQVEPGMWECISEEACNQRIKESA